MANNRKQKKKIEQTRREVWGVALIALGVFLGVCQHVNALGVVGLFVTKMLFGLCGWCAYALPPALLIGGVLLIALALNKPRRGRTTLVLLLGVFALTLMHLIARPTAGDAGYFAYIGDAYRLGVEFTRGGGALGAILCNPLLLLIGEPGTYIALIAGLLIMLLLITRLSLRETGHVVTERVKAGLQQASEWSVNRRQLYTETLDEQIEAPRARTQTTRGSKRAARMRPVREHALAVDDVDFLPTEGPLRRSGQFEEARLFPAEDAPAPRPKVRDLKNPEAQLFEEPDITYYDEATAPEPDDFAAVPIKPAHNVTPFPAPEMARPKPEPAPAFMMLEQPPTEPTERPPYVPPSFSLLNPPSMAFGRSSKSPTEKGKILIDTLESFHVQARIVNISVGPVITRFEIAPAPGVRVNKITALSDDIALALAAPRVRIEAPIPGKAAVGIEVPNKDSVTVVLRDIVESKEFTQAKSPITLALGKDIAGKIIVSDLAKMPHLLIAGATGSGKSVCINDIIISLAYKCSPDELQLILVDPKVVELSSFSVLPHLRVPVVTDPKKAAGALAGGVREMTERYKKFAAVGARDLARFNELMQDPKERLPKLVIIIDELADLMMVSPDTVEDSICRIAQLGRASGIHLIVATQRPSADVITGLIKANIPSRIAFAVASAIDSRIILDSGGAEKLLGRGDMLFHPNGAGKPVRAQCAFVSDEEVERIVKHFSQQAMAPTFDEQMIEDMDTGSRQGTQQGNGKQEDELLGEAVRIVLDSGQASISMIQRRLRVGYARAARLVDIMEQHGYVSGFDGSKPRKLLITRAKYEQVFGQVKGGDVPFDYDEEENGDA